MKENGKRFRQQARKWSRAMEDLLLCIDDRLVRSLLRFMDDDRVLDHGRVLWDFASWVGWHWRKFGGRSRSLLLARFESLLLQVRHDRAKGAWMLGNVLGDDVATLPAKRILEKVLVRASSDHGKMSAAHGLVHLAKRRPERRASVRQALTAAIEAAKSPRLREYLRKARTAVGRRQLCVSSGPARSEEEHKGWIQLNRDARKGCKELVEFMEDYKPLIMALGESKGARRPRLRLHARNMRKECLDALEEPDKPQTVAEVEETLRKKNIRPRGRKTTLRRVVGEILAEGARRGTIERVARGRYRAKKSADRAATDRRT